MDRGDHQRPRRRKRRVRRENREENNYKILNNPYDDLSLG